VAIKKNIAVFAVAIILLSAISPVSLAETSITTYTIEYRGFESDFTQFGSSFEFVSGLPSKKSTVEAGGSYTILDIEPKFDDFNFRDYTFDGWNLKKVDGVIDRTVVYHAGDVIENINNSMRLIAVWKRKETDIVVYSMLSYLRGGNGDPTIIEGKAPDDKLLELEQEITLINCPYTYDGYKFLGWIDSKGNLYDPGDKYTVTSYNSIFTAEWSSDPNAIVKNSVSYSSGASSVTGNAPNGFKLYKKDYFIVAENTYKYDGYKFICWTDSKNKTYMPGDKYTVASADGNITLTAKWEKLPDIFTINITAGEGGSVSQTGQSEIQQGDEVNLIITPDQNFVFKAAKINGSEVQCDGAVLNIKDIEENLNIEIEFALKTFNITLDIGENGSISPSDKTTAEIGSSVSYTITPDNNYEIDQITIDGVAATAENGILNLENITTNHIISVTFRQKPGASTGDESDTIVPQPKDYTGIAIAILLIILSVFALIALYAVNTQKKNKKIYRKRR